jgi:CRISPR/Cas system CSM-associated protein Csm5 (group 7 of RAMP superfamily)
MPPIKMKLKTLSPVHIGSGNKIEPFEYITIGNKYYRMNLDKCFEFIFSEKEGALDQFNSWIEESAYNMWQNPNQAVANFQFDFFGFIKNKLHDNALL